MNGKKKVKVDVRRDLEDEEFFISEESGVIGRVAKQL
jgi:hypothetical protein